MVKDTNSKVQHEHEVVFSDRNTMSADQIVNGVDFQSRIEEIELGEAVVLDLLPLDAPNKDRAEDSILLKWLMNGYKSS